MYTKTFISRRRNAPRILFARCYQSDCVYGYKNKIRKEFTVPDQVLNIRNKESNFYRFVTAFREEGHKIADVNPVALKKPPSQLPQLEPKRYGLHNSDKVTYKGILNHRKENGTVQEAEVFLRNVYCKHLSAELSHLETEEETEWLIERMERTVSEEVEKETKIQIATDMLKSQAFDNFLANKYPGLKKYGGEGAESMMAFFGEFFKLSALDTIEEIVLCMPHRGRLNLLTGMLRYPPVQMFLKLKGLPDFPGEYRATGDVLSHCISSVDLSWGNGLVHVSLLYNPSHLEAVNSVSMGKTRAKQMDRRDGDYSSEERRWSDKILNLQVHGDAALTGQGVNQECLQLSKVAHYKIGGSVHLVVNNQLGFTTPSDRGRSSMYCTDLAKLISSPVLHVNGDHPELVVKATRIAFEYQRKFRKDVFVDLNCYRQWGHNELDDPTFTNPALYKIIRSRMTIPDLYAKKVVEDGVMSEREVEEIVKGHNEWLNRQLKRVDSYKPLNPSFEKKWKNFIQATERVTTWDTGVSTDLLKYIGEKSVSYPENFKIHPHLLKTFVKPRQQKLRNGEKIDWATAEALAVGSLLYEGYNVRISGQDVGRGTFSQRHAMLVDQDTNKLYIPLNDIDREQKAFLEVANSILSEEAVLGYEYGMSIENPNNLIMWEAQFGDFFNGAQIMIDTFVSSGEAKWLWCSGLVMLLPHGYDGAGPEHSSSRIERFLQLTDSKENKVDGDDVNMEICQPSTPAQYFHLLRRQMIRNHRKPLIVIAPKTLLRLSSAVSNLSEFQENTWFRPVLGDEHCDPSKVKKVILCAGKHFYNLVDKRRELKCDDVAIVRLESFCPFPTMHLQEELSKYSKANVFVWSQEEPRNMGGWSFIKPRFENLLGRRIYYSGRVTLPTPAVGIGKWHREQTEDAIVKPFTFKI